jgi:hypothetical protein
LHFPGKLLGGGAIGQSDKKSVMSKTEIRAVAAGGGGVGANFDVAVSRDFAQGLPDGILSKQKNPIWVNFRGAWKGRFWCILWTFGLFYGHLGYFEAISYTFFWYTYFSPFWYVVPRKIWQP